MQEVEEGSSLGDDEDGRKGTADVRTRRWVREEGPDGAD